MDNLLKENSDRNSPSAEMNGKLNGFFTTPLFKNISLLLTLIFIVFIIPTLIGFGKSAFSSQDVLNQFNTYQNFAYAGIITFILGFIFILAINKAKSETKEYRSLLLASPGEAPAVSSLIPGAKRISNLSIFLFSLILFSLAGLINFASPNQIIFSGIAKLGQEFTAVDNIIFSGALIPVAENLGMSIVITISVILLILGAVRFKWKKNFVVLLAVIIIPFLTALYGYINHIMRYGASGYDMAIIVGFWYVLGLITVLTGSFIPAWIMHFCNNFFLDLKQYFSSDATIVIAGFFVVLLLIIFLRLYVFKNKGKK